MSGSCKFCRIVEGLELSWTFTRMNLSWRFSTSIRLTEAIP